MKTFFRFSWRRTGVLAATLLTAVLAGPPARADVVFIWNEAMLQFSAAADETLAPFLEARAFAMAHLAMEQAIASTASQRDAGDRLMAQRAAAVCAAHGVLVNLLPAGVKQFDALAERHLSNIPDGLAKTGGMSTGRAAAARVLLEREKDGWVDLTLSHPPAGPRPDASEGAASALARGQRLAPSPWLKAEPFVLKSAQQFRVLEVQTLQRSGDTVVENSLVFSKLFDRVDRAAAFEAAERCWSQRSLVTWNRIARQASVGRVNGLEAQARLLATLNVALAEATLSTLHWRHAVGTWRLLVTDTWDTLHGAAPRSTDVVARIDGGTADELVRRDMHNVLIPPTPNYPSLAAAVAGAAQAALVTYFKTDQISFTLPVARRATAEASAAPPAPRMFTSISAAARECAFLATLDGRHTREACLAGYMLGDTVGASAGKRTLRGPR